MHPAPRASSPCAHRCACRHGHTTGPSRRRPRVLVDCPDALTPHPLAIGIAERKPRLQLVFEVGIDERTHVAVEVEPLAAFSMDPLPDETDGRSAIVDLGQRAFRSVVEGRGIRQLAERAEFEEKRAGLRRIGLGTADLARPEVHIAVRDAGRRIERWEQPCAEILGKGQKTRFASELVGGEKSAKEADRNLEVADEDILLERGRVEDQTHRLVGLPVQPHEDHRVEGIHGRHQEGRAVPVAISH